MIKRWQDFLLKYSINLIIKTQDYNVAKESSQLVGGSLNEITYITVGLDKYINENIINEKQHSLENIENILLNINFEKN